MPCSPPPRCARPLDDPVDRGRDRESAAALVEQAFGPVAPALGRPALVPGARAVLG
jgi:hypothetical protein